VGKIWETGVLFSVQECFIKAGESIVEMPFFRLSLHA
jgi:hypothetical protein